MPKIKISPAILVCNHLLSCVPAGGEGGGTMQLCALDIARGTAVKMKSD